MKSFIPPVILIISAIVFPSLKQATYGKDALYFGYRNVGSVCVATNVHCADIVNTIVCKDASGNTLYKYIGPTLCAELLWKPIE
jgi:hypothetical protein